MCVENKRNFSSVTIVFIYTFMISGKNVPMSLCLAEFHKATTAITKNLNKNYKLKIHVLLVKNI